MKLYQIRVIETRSHGSFYTVEADSASEALEKAALGETVEAEEDDYCQAVLEREVLADSLEEMTDHLSELN